MRKVIFCLLIPIIALALEVITDPYDDIDYESINVYTYNDCECPQESFDDFINKITF